MKQKIIDALTDLAAWERGNKIYYLGVEENTGIHMIPMNYGNECHVSGLKDSGLELKKLRRDSKDYPTEYSIVVDGVNFREITSEPWEDETK